MAEVLYTLAVGKRRAANQHTGWVDAKAKRLKFMELQRQSRISLSYAGLPMLDQA